jgi:hypothetical protein
MPTCRKWFWAIAATLQAQFGLFGRVKHAYIATPSIDRAIDVGAGDLISDYVASSWRVLERSSGVIVSRLRLPPMSWTILNLPCPTLLPYH